MNRRWGIITIGAALIAAWMILACGPTWVDLGKQGTVSVKALPTKEIRFESVYVEQRGSDLYLFGRLQKNGGGDALKGMVKAVIVDPDGVLLSELNIPVLTGGKKRPGWYGAHFRAKVPLVLSEGSAVRLAFHPCSCSLEAPGGGNVALRR